MADIVAHWVLSETVWNGVSGNRVLIKDWPLDQYLWKGKKGRACQRQKEDFNTP